MKIKQGGSLFSNQSGGHLCRVCAGACCFCRWKRMVFAMCFNGIFLVQVVWSLVTFRRIGTIYQIRLLIKNCQNCPHHEYFLRPYVMWYFVRFLIIHSTMFNPFLEVKCKSYLQKNNPCMMFCQPFHCSIYIFVDSILPLPSSGVVFREKNSTPWPYSWMSCQPSRLRLMHLGDASFIFRNADVLGMIQNSINDRMLHGCDSHDAMCYSPIQHFTFLFVDAEYRGESGCSQIQFPWYQNPPSKGPNLKRWHQTPMDFNAPMVSESRQSPGISLLYFFVARMKISMVVIRSSKNPPVPCFVVKVSKLLCC
jgi:hypothetical protein